MRVHAVIVSHNTQDLTEHCLSHLTRELSGLDSAITVVDNASQDGTQEMLRSKYPQVRLLANSRNTGFAAACNQGAFSAPDSDFVLFVNSDTEPESGVVASICRYMDEHPECAALGCRLTNWDGTPQHSFANWPRFSTEFFGRKLFSFLSPKQFPDKRHVISQPIPVESLVGAFFMVKRSDFLAVHGFDERYFFFLEETDLCRRLRELGRQVIYHPGFAVKHKQGASANKNPKWSRHQFHRSKYQFLLKWEGKPACFAVYVKNFFVCALKSLFYFLTHTITLRTSRKWAVKEEVAFWLWRHHVLGFPPFLDLSQARQERDAQDNLLFSFLAPRQNESLLRHLKEPDTFQPIKQSNVASTWLCPNAEKPFVLKIEKRDLSRFFKQWINQTFGVLNYKNSARLQSIGVFVPPPMAWGEFRKSRWGEGDFFVSEWVPDTDVLNFFEKRLMERFQGQDFHKAKRALIVQLAERVRDLHDRCVFHHDLKASNILIDLSSVNGALKFRFVLTDLEKISFGYFWTSRLALKNLVQLNKSFIDLSKVSLRERLRFLSVYLGERAARTEKRVWLTQIRLWTERILKRKGEALKTPFS